MPDMIQPVGAMIKPPDPQVGINTMSGILGLQQQRQALQTGQYQQQSAQANAQMTQQDAANRQAAGSFFKNFDIAKHHGDDGTLDLDSALTSDEFKATGDASPEIAKSLLGIKNSQLAAKTSLAGLNGTLRDQFSSQVAGLAEDPDVKSGNQTGRGKVLDAIDQFGKVGGPDAQRVAGVYGRVLQNTPPEKMAQALANLQLQAKSAGEQMPQAATRDTGAQVVSGSVTPGTGAFNPAGPGIQKQVGPGANIVEDTYGHKFILDPQTNRVTPVGSGTPPGAAPPQGPPGSPARPQGLQFAQPVPGQADAQASIESTRKADADYGLNRHVNDQILRLSKDTATGPGTDIWHHALGAIAGTGGGNNVSDYQTISAYLDRQAALSAKQMGLPDTNAGLATAASLSGTTGYQPKALQTKVQLTDALVEGAHQFRQGLDKVVGTGPNQDLTKYQAFRSAWAANFDPRILIVENALKRGESHAAIKKDLGLSANDMAELKQKSNNLRKLESGVIQ